jgi:hypothetical protein
MRKIVIIVALLAFIYSCEKNRISTSSRYTARVAGYDLNCATCILEFPDDSQKIMEAIGKSPDNLYEAVNLNKNDLQIGEMIKIELRKAEPEELNNCITLYPSYNYENLFVTDVENFENFIPGDTLVLPYQKCADDTENQTYLCFESVLGDSRCPTGAQCIWEGNAKVQFKYERLNEKPVVFDLNTHKGFACDTLIDGYKFTLLDLHPYPSLKDPVDKKDYKAYILVENEVMGN